MRVRVRVGLRVRARVGLRVGARAGVRVRVRPTLAPSSPSAASATWIDSKVATDIRAHASRPRPAAASARPSAKARPAASRPAASPRPVAPSKPLKLDARGEAAEGDLAEGGSCPGKREAPAGAQALAAPAPPFFAGPRFLAEGSSGGPLAPPLRFPPLPVPPARNVSWASLAAPAAVNSAGPGGCNRGAGGCSRGGGGWSRVCGGEMSAVAEVAEMAEMGGLSLVLSCCATRTRRES